MRSLLAAALISLTAVFVLLGVHVEAAPAKTATWNALNPVIDKTWDKSRWRRGQPKPKTVRFYRRSLARADRIDRALIKRRWRKSKRLYYKHRSYCRSGMVIEGRVSWFSDGTTASGLSAAYNAGLAINIAPGTEWGWNNSTTDSWMSSAARGKPVKFWIWIAGRFRGVFPAIDKGPAGYVGRALDFSGPAVDQMGIPRSTFPTDSWGRAKLIPEGCLPQR